MVFATKNGTSFGDDDKWACSSLRLGQPIWMVVHRMVFDFFSFFIFTLGGCYVRDNEKKITARYFIGKELDSYWEG